MSDDILNQIEAEIARQEKMESLIKCLAADNLQSRPTEGQDKIFRALTNKAKYIMTLGGNQSGKTTALIRQLVWVIEETHPYWERPNTERCNNKLCANTDLEVLGDSTTPIYRCRACGNIWKAWTKEESLNIILCGENRLNIMQNLWEPRIKPLLTESEKWKPVKIGPFVGWIEHIENGNKVFFFPHGQGVEQARKTVQGFTIHSVFMDELAGLKVIEELQRRVDARMGYFMAAFTMKTLDAEVARYMRKSEEAGAVQIFKISKLDNPVYAGIKDLVLAQLEGYSEADKNKILYGELGDGDDKVFSYSESDVVVDGLPADYTNAWRHAEIIDPAIQSKAGYMLLGEDPSTKLWYTVKAEYITGMQDPIDLLKEIQDRRGGYNIVKTVSDNQAWFTGTAKKLAGIKCYTPPNKQRKDTGKLFIIKRAQIFLSESRIRIQKKHEDFLDELDNYRWKEGSKDTIINSNKYHIIDCFMYFVDTLPKDVFESPGLLTWQQEIMRYNNNLSRRNKKSPLQKRKVEVEYLRGDSVNQLFNKLGIKKW
jgi:hypothetical protein